MSATEMKNVVASVLARLRNHSKSSGAPFQQVLQQYAIERFVPLPRQWPDICFNIRSCISPF